MTNLMLIEMLQEDLKNERKHLLAYTQFAVQLSGLHREELREFCEDQAKDELNHVTEFSELIVHLGGVPNVEVNPYPADLSCPVEIMKAIVEMEEEVADKYTQRLRETESFSNSATAYTHLFYEEQLLDSWKTAKEVRKMIPPEECWAN
jgi:bacterioferritin (cytochrome b1)